MVAGFLCREWIQPVQLTVLYSQVYPSCPTAQGLRTPSHLVDYACSDQDRSMGCLHYAFQLLWERKKSYTCSLLIVSRPVSRFDVTREALPMIQSTAQVMIEGELNPNLPDSFFAAQLLRVFSTKMRNQLVLLLSVDCYVRSTQRSTIDFSMNPFSTKFQATMPFHRTCQVTSK